MFIEFEKWHGTQNDFIVTWMVSTDKDTVLESLKRQASRLCARDGRGVSADGILVLETTHRRELYPQALHIINADGSLAANCGNGLRCAASSVLRRHMREQSSMIDGVTLAVGEKSFDCRFVNERREPLVAVTMPKPHVDQENSWHDALCKRVDDLCREANLKLLEVHTVTIGNPHVVILLEEASSKLCLELGPKLQSVSELDGVNVHICHLEEHNAQDQQRAKSELGERIGELYRVFPWERGVGPTMSCGSGGTAVAIAAYLGGGVERQDWVALDMPGGRLYVKQADTGEEAILAGPAVFVFEGRFEI